MKYLLSHYCLLLFISIVAGRSSQGQSIKNSEPAFSYIDQYGSLINVDTSVLSVLKQAGTSFFVNNLNGKQIDPGINTAENNEFFIYKITSAGINQYLLTISMHSVSKLSNQTDTSSSLSFGHRKRRTGSSGINIYKMTLEIRNGKYLLGKLEFMRPEI